MRNFEPGTQVGPIATVFPSQLGWMALRWEDSRLARLAFAHRSSHSALNHAVSLLPDVVTVVEELSELPTQLADLVERLQAFACGEGDDFLDVPLQLGTSTPFRRAVLERCRLIPRGQLMTYGELAVQAGSPRAARAVGNIMAKNQIPLIIPCHRVVGAGRAIGGYSAPDGLRTKRRLLRLEGSFNG